MRNAFLLGAFGYPALELMARGRTHWSMAVAGGMSASLIRQVSGWRIGRKKQAVLCGAGITAIEYGCGQLWNRDFRVWDYRRMPLNWRGQVCLPYSLLWCGMSWAALGLLRPKRKS